MGIWQTGKLRQLHIAVSGGRAIPRQIRGWDFWEITNPDGSLAWLGLTRERAASAIDRQKVWTLVPSSRLFVANWFVTEDRLRSEGQIWNYQMIDIADARELLVAVPQPSAEVIKRLCRPEAVLSLDQLDNHSVLKVMGGRANQVLRERSNVRPTGDPAGTALHPNSVP